MHFEILSHACLFVKSKTHSVIIDPWLIGSCYWRSWWNFPSPQFDDDEIRAVDAVVISHVHWDHWHGATLKKFFKGKHFIVPDEPSQRSQTDLLLAGFGDLEALPHGATVEIGDIKVTLYQFGLFLNDSVVVVECDGVTILDANDAKMAGRSLEYVVRRHGPIDFALRSHSSANPRINFGIVGETSSYVADDREHYFRSFKLFMDAVAPRYAIPFASNHCHLHDDVFNMNSYISNPLQLREYIAQIKNPPTWSLQVMLPGSSWNKERGFQLGSESAFNDIEAELLAYRLRVAPTLEKNRAFEQNATVPKRTFTRFIEQLSSRPIKWRNASFNLALTKPDGQINSYFVDPANATIVEIVATIEPSDGRPVMVMPAIIFRDAVWKNMFHHAGISKRCHFLASSNKDLRRLKSVFSHLEAVELGVFPLNRAYLWRFCKVYAARWREVFVYIAAAWHARTTGKPLYLVEEIILTNTRPPLQPENRR